MTFEERRAKSREALTLAIVLGDGTSAITRDISETGMFIETGPITQLDDWLCIEYVLPEAKLRFEAAGEVVRIERGQETTGIAIRLHSPRLLPIF